MLTPKAPNVLPVGAMIEEFRIVRVLGIGSFGIVYQCENTYLPETAAIKEFLPSELAFRGADGRVVPLTDQTEETFRWARDRFLQEAKTLWGLAHPQGHPSIVRVTRFHEANGTAYMFMEFEQGRSLSEILDSEGRLSPEDLDAFLYPLLDGLERIHAANILHRDIKPANVLIRADGSPVLIDFGAARRAVRGGERTVVSAYTPVYAALEQYHDVGDQGPWTDIYSLGATLYQAVTGKKPLSAAERLCGESQIPVAEQCRGSYPQPILHAIDIALEIKPEDRPQSVSDWRQCLAAMPAASERDEAVVVMPAKGPEDPTSAVSSPEPEGPPQWISRWWHALAALFPLRKPKSGKRETRDPWVETSSPAQSSSEIESTILTSPSLASGPADEVQSPDETGPTEARSDRTVFVSSGDSLNRSDVAIRVEACHDSTQVASQIRIERFPFSIGRAADLRLNDPGVSRHHAQILSEGSKYFVEDLRSTSGTFVNGRSVRAGERVPLLVGDILHLGNTRLSFVVDLPALPDLTHRVLDGRYLLKRCLHESIRAATYEAEDTKLPRSLAVKVFSPSLKVFAHDTEDFRHQAEAAAKLCHRNICRVIDFGEGTVEISASPPSFPYLCMELLEHGTLAEVLKNESAPPLATVTSWVETLAGALDYAHERGVVHGGIKPGCILFDEEWEPSLTDFSVSRGRGTSTQTPLFGAPSFLAPEQWEGESPGPASDQYALAAVAYLMITGARPYEGLEDPEIRQRKFRRGPVPAHEEARGIEREDVPEPVSDVLAKALSRDPEGRYKSTGEFAGALKEAFTPEKTSKQARIFVSYRRESSHGWPILFAKRLREHHGMRVFLDTQRVDRVARFPERLRQEIETCDVFVCFLGKETLGSDWVREEILHAHECKKPMIPVFQQDFDRAAQVDIDSHIESMLEFEAVRLFDYDDRLVEAAVSMLAERIGNTLA